MRVACIGLGARSNEDQTNKELQYINNGLFNLAAKGEIIIIMVRTLIT